MLGRVLGHRVRLLRLPVATWGRTRHADRSPPGAPHGPPRSFPSDPFDYVIFGATGDLTMRKLLPALYHPLPRRADPRRGPHHRGGALGPQHGEVPRACRRGAVPLRQARDLRREDRRRVPRAGPLRPGQWRHRRELAEPLQAISRTAPPIACACSISRPRPACTATPAATCPSAAWSPPTPAWCWKSRSAPISPRPARSTKTWASSSMKSRSSGSTTISARRRCRT